MTQVKGTCTSEILPSTRAVLVTNVNIYSRQGLSLKAFWACLTDWHLWVRLANLLDIERNIVTDSSLAHLPHRLELADP